MAAAVVIAPRFQGPPDGANGGYVAGLLAGRVPWTVAVTLRRPVPLGTPLALEGDAAGARLRDPAGELLAVAEPAPGPPAVGEVPKIGLAAGRAARPDPAMLAHHPFPRCFGCGPARDPADAVALHPGPLPGGAWATTWTPPAGLPHEADGTLPAAITWVALDCPSSFAAVPAGAPPHVLGRLEGRVDAPPRVGEELIVLAWPLGSERRKRWGATAITGPGGELRALARATWIALR